MEILGIIVFLAALCNFLLGFFVFIKDPSKRINRLFGISGFITSIWVFTNFMMGAEGTIFWLKSASAFGALVPLTALLWVLELCGRKITLLKRFLLSSLGVVFFIISYINGLIITQVKKVYLGGFQGETGPLFIFYFIYIILILAFIIYTLLSEYFQSKGIRKLQIGYVLIGGIFYIGTVSVVSFILPLSGILEYTALDSPSSLFLLFFTTLAITKYHLFEIRVILTELLVGVMGIVLLILPFLMPNNFLKILTIGILLLFWAFGYLLIKATHREIKRREEIEKLYQELKVLDKAKSEFISMASHQLRTPLTAIKGYISMMIEGSYNHLAPKVKEKMKNVFYSNERLIRIVNDLLNISKIELGKMELNKETVQLEETIDGVYQEMKPEAEKKNLKFIWQKSKIPLPQIELDPLKIRQAISNLIDNAIRYTQKGEIEIKAKKINSKIRVSVRDTGEGLTKEEQRKIFEGFTRGAAGITFWIEGAGLGLYIAKRYIELHQGKIWVESKGKGKGSIFYIELPTK